MSCQLGFQSITMKYMRRENKIVYQTDTISSILFDFRLLNIANASTGLTLNEKDTERDKSTKQQSTHALNAYRLNELFTWENASICVASFTQRENSANVINEMDHMDIG